MQLHKGLRMSNNGDDLCVYQSQFKSEVVNLVPHYEENFGVTDISKYSRDIKLPLRERNLNCLDL